MKFTRLLFELKSRACVRAIQSKNVATFANINLSQFICDFPKETNAKVVYGDHIEISVFVVCFIPSSCH